MRRTSMSSSSSPSKSPSFQHFLEKEEEWVNKKNKKRLEMQRNKEVIDMQFKPQVVKIN